MLAFECRKSTQGLLRQQGILNSFADQPYGRFGGCAFAIRNSFNVYVLKGYTLHGDFDICGQNTGSSETKFQLNSYTFYPISIIQLRRVLKFFL